MKFLILLLIPFSAFTRTIECLGPGFAYNSTKIKIGTQKVLIEMNSYFAGGRDMNLSQAVSNFGKHLVRVSFDRESCIISASKNILRCHDNKKRIIKVSGSEEKSYKAQSLTYSLTLNKELIPVDENKAYEDNIYSNIFYLSSLMFIENNSTKYLQVTFPKLLSTGKNPCI